MKSKLKTIFSKMKEKVISERGELGDSVIFVAAVVIGVGLMVIYPLMSIAEKSDDVSQLAVETAVTETLEDVRSTGKLTLDKYDKLVQELAATGNAYEVNLQVQVLDENPGVKTTQAETTKIGENVYYTMEDYQVKEALNKGTLGLKEGDILTITVNKTSTSIAEKIQQSVFHLTGSDSNSTTKTVMVTTNGTTR